METISNILPDIKKLGRYTLFSCVFSVVFCLFLIILFPSIDRIILGNIGYGIFHISIIFSLMKIINFPLRKTTFKKVSLLLLFKSLAALIALLIFLDWLYKTINLDKPTELDIILQHGRLEQIIFYATIIVIGPAAEEIIHRGYILHYCRQRTSTINSVIISSALFAILHVYPSLMIETFIAGLFLSFIFIKSQSLMLCILLHAVNNAVACFLEVRHTSISEVIEKLISHT